MADSPGAQGGITVIDSVQLVVRQADQPDRQIELREGTTRIGRADDNDVVLPDIGVSRRHARIITRDDAVIVEDLGSGNGTFYRGFRIQSQMAEDGDEFVIDPFVLQLRVRGAGESQDEVTQLERQPMARLDVVSGAGLHRTSYPLGVRGLTIGRSETRDVVIPDPAASRHHCTVLAREGRYIAKDMGSANGIYINGIRVREAVLEHGDLLRIGNTELRFLLVGVAVADTTERPALESWGRDDADLSLSLPMPEPTGSGGMGWLGRIAAILATVGVLSTALMMTVLAGVAVAWVVYVRTRPLTLSLTQEAHPPAWQLNLPAGLPPTTIEELDRHGSTAWERRDHDMALQHMYRSLTGLPGRVSAERMAMAAGEALVLEALQPVLEAHAEERSEREARRSRLLRDVQRGGRRGRRAEAALREDFAEDLVVREAMSWPAGPIGQAQAERLTEGSRLAGQGRWAEAAAIYREVQAEAVDPVLRSNASAGHTIAARRLARDTHELWADAMLADAAGDPDAVLRTTGALLEAHPDDPSAAALRQRYGVAR